MVVRALQIPFALPSRKCLENFISITSFTFDVLRTDQKNHPVPVECGRLNCGRFGETFGH